MRIIKRVFKHKWLLIFLLVISVLAAYLQNKLNGESTTTSQQTALATVEKGTVTATISASGTVQTANYLAVTTSANGIVKKIYVTEGAAVTKGDKIMDITLDQEGELSLSNAYSSYLRAKNSVDSAKNSLLMAESSVLQKEEAFETEKERNSYQTDTERYNYKLAENDYLNAKNSYDLQKSAITQAEIALQSAYTEYQAYASTITANASGTVANIVATEGTTISNSVTSDRSVQTVASIKQAGTPTAQLNITELDVAKVKVGQKVKVTLSSISDTVFDGTVTGIDKIGTQSSGVANYPVSIKFDTDSDLVLPNMSVTADIIIDSHADVLYIPTGALTTRGDQKYVIVVTNNAQNSVAVTTGLTDGTNTEILEGLNENDQIILNTLPTSGFTTTTSTTNRGGGAGGGAMMGPMGM